MAIIIAFISQKGGVGKSTLARALAREIATSADDLKPAVKEFHSLVNNFIPKSKLIFALNRIGTIAEDNEARAYIKEAGYETFEGCLLERPAYRKAQNLGLAVTETNYKTLNEKADLLMQNLIDRVIKNG